MRRAVKKTRWSLVIILIFAAALSYVGFRYFYSPKPLDVFVIDSPSLTYGDTVLSGTIRTSGDTYLLILDNTDLAVELDLIGLKDLIDQPVVAEGYLYQDEFGTNKMTVKQIRTINP
jgi:hypothetical protein